jgi:hypothetical protein
MAHIKTVHKAAVISTELSVKDIKKLEAINPDALEIRTEKGDVLFRVATGKEDGISKYGIVFATDSKISVLTNSDKALDRDAVAESFGAILLQLSRVEEQAKAALESIGSNLDDLIEIEDEETTEATEPRRRNRR